MIQSERAWKTGLLIGLLGFALALPAFAQVEPVPEPVPKVKAGKKKDPLLPIVSQLKDLNSTLVELRGLLLQRERRDRDRDTLQRLDTLDRIVAFLDAELRKALDERDRLSQELISRQGKLAQSQESLASGDQSTRERLSLLIPVQQEAVDRTREQTEHLDARITELRRTIQSRRSQREAVEAEIEIQDSTPA